MIRKAPILCIVVASLILSPSKEAGCAEVLQGFRETAFRLSKLFAPQVHATPPPWAQPESPPLFTFAWLSDMHLDESNRQRMAQALQWIDQHLQPTFLLLTGDNSAIVPPGSVGVRPSGNPLGEQSVGDQADRDFRRQQFLKQWLAEHWKRPYAIIPGDNWPKGFDRVFGPRQYRIECGGLHLVLLAPDCIYHGGGMEGLSTFDPETLNWLRKDLAIYRDNPTLVAIHEPIFPPTFLDAPQLRKLIKASPHVVGVLQGHLHVDLEMRDQGQTYWVAPAIGPGQPPAFKYGLVYRHAIILRTVELQAETGSWQLVEKWQKIDIPESLQKALHPVEAGNKAPGSASGEENPLRMVSSRPARAVREDPALTKRAGQLLDIIQQFLLKEATQVLLRSR